MAVPYVFTPGTVISSAQVNANFAYLDGSGGGGGGSIGQFITSAGNFTTTIGSWTTAVTLSVPAGDWDLIGYMDANVSGGTANNFSAAISLSQTMGSDTSARYITWGSTDTSGYGAPVPGRRLQVSSTTPVYLIVFVGGETTGASVTVNAAIDGRRWG